MKKVIYISANDTETILFCLPDCEFDLGGKFDAIARNCGYASGRAAANDLNLWSSTVAGAISAISSK